MNYISTRLAFIHWKIILMTLPIAEYKGPLLVSFYYILMYYAFIILQVVCTYYLYFKAKANKKDDEKVGLKKMYYENKDPLKLTVDRAVGNTLEQMVRFICGLWVYAVFVDTEKATQLGFVYIFCRALYPIAFHLGPWRVLSTTPCYIIIGYFWFGVFKAM